MYYWESTTLNLIIINVIISTVSRPLCSEPGFIPSDSHFLQIKVSFSLEKNTETETNVMNTTKDPVCIWLFEIFWTEEARLIGALQKHSFPVTEQGDHSVLL